MLADAAAKLTCKTMCPDFAEVLHARRKALDEERSILLELLKMTVQIQKARAAALQQQSREESHANQVEQRSADALKQQLTTWAPADVLQVSLPVNPADFATAFARGVHLIDPFFTVWTNSLACSTRWAYGT